MTLPNIYGRCAVVQVAVGRRVAEHALARVDAEQVEQMLHLGRHVGLQQDAADPERLDARVDDLVQLFFLCSRGILMHEFPGRGVLHEPVRLCSAQCMLDFRCNNVAGSVKSKDYEPIEALLRWSPRPHRSLAPPPFALRLSMADPPALSSVSERHGFHP